MYQNLPFLFVSMIGNNVNIYDSTTELTESEQHHIEQTVNNFDTHNCYKDETVTEKFQYLKHQLISLGQYVIVTLLIMNVYNFLITLGYINNKTIENDNSCCGECAVDNWFISEKQIGDNFEAFVQGCLRSHLLKMAAVLSEVIFFCFTNNLIF